MESKTDCGPILESLADRLEREGCPLDRGVIWADKQIDLNDVVFQHDLEDISELFSEDGEQLFCVYWEPRGGMLTSCTSVTAHPLLSQRTLIVQFDDCFEGHQLIALVPAGQPEGTLRVAQAVLAGEATGMRVNGLPTSLQLACDGLIAVDALRNGLKHSQWAREQLLGDDEYCNADPDTLHRGEERQQALLTALEEQIGEEDDRNEQYARLYDEVRSTPSWLYAIDCQQWERIAELGDDSAVDLPLYAAPPSAWERLQPHEAASDLWYLAAGVLALYDQL